MGIRNGILFLSYKEECHPPTNGILCLSYKEECHRPTNWSSGPSVISVILTHSFLLRVVLFLHGEKGKRVSAPTWDK